MHGVKIMPNGTNVNFFGSPFADDTSLLFSDLGLSGNDVLEGDSGNDFLDGLDGIDQIKGEEGEDTLEGGFGDDSLFGGEQNDSILGEQGDDYIEGGFQSDYIEGGIGNDIIWGDNAVVDPLLVPGSSLSPDNNLLVGPIPDDNDIVNVGVSPLGVIEPLDIVNVRNPAIPDFSLSLFFDPVLEGDDTIFGGDGNDQLYGEIGDDDLFGGADHDTLVGGAGYDLLDGGLGDDVLDGGDDSDTLIGGLGSDILTGGDGFDVFVFSPEDSLINGDIDRITDFDVNQDRIDLTAFELSVGGEEGGNSQYAFDDFSNGMTQGLDSSFYQVGANVIIDARPTLGYDLGSLGDSGQIIIENVNIDDLGGFNFIFTPEVSETIV